MKILGRGANVLVSDDGFDGAVVRLDSPAFKRIEFTGKAGLNRASPAGIAGLNRASPGDGGAEVGAGVDLMTFSRICVRNGLSGLEPMAGIPATIGGAVRMNAGGRHGEFGRVVRSVVVMQADGRINEYTAQQCGFGYRRSALGDGLILSASLNLAAGDPRTVAEQYEEFLTEKQRSQPLADHSAGCIFKNPDGESAGALIDRAGLKGASSGLASVSHRHANFIVARSGAAASDCLRLIDIVRDRVRKVFGIELELEIDIWQPVGEGSLV